MERNMNPKYPLYVISKGRWARPLTARSLERMNVPYHIVVEPQEYDSYAEVIDPDKIYVLPFSNLGQGGIPARNWVWEHSISIGAEKHWIVDDNIHTFRRLHNNYMRNLWSGSGFRATEDFTDRYENVALSGLQYEFFLPTKRKHPAFLLNTRIYSCLLIRNDIPYRWRGRYNEDTDLSLRALKDGWCTILVCAFPIKKATTMTVKGGNTDELYKGDGRLKMAQSLQEQHPDVTKIIKRWGRWQHYVDYTPFKDNKLVKKEGLEIPQGINEYGMKLVNVKDIKENK